jgi:hypothetical protein
MTNPPTDEIEREVWFKRDRVTGNFIQVEPPRGSYFKAMVEVAAELTRLREQIAAKDAAITRFVNVHGVLTKEDREYLRAARGR